MAKRDSGYARRRADLYETPAWVTDALVERLVAMNGVRLGTVLEPACGSGKMVRALRRNGFNVLFSDVRKPVKGGVRYKPKDFLSEEFSPCDAIITNPPYKLARDFIEKALRHAKVVAMLLPSDYDYAKTRQHLFGHNTSFAMKLQLTRRIVWFDSKNAAPSENHAWYVWIANRYSAPVVRYYLERE